MSQSLQSLLRGWNFCLDLSSLIQSSKHRQRAFVFPISRDSYLSQVFLPTWFSDVFIYLLRHLVCRFHGYSLSRVFSNCTGCMNHSFRIFYRTGLLQAEILAEGELAASCSQSSTYANMLTLHFHFQSLCQALSLDYRKFLHDCQNISLILMAKS